MFPKIISFVLIAILASLVYMSTAIAETQQTNSGTYLFFMESEKGIDPYPTRFILTEKYLRIDSGKNDDDFVLFDAEKDSIFNVARVDRSILVIRPEDAGLDSGVRKLTEQLNLKVVQEANTAIPKIGGFEPKHYQFIVNGENCAEVTATDGLLPKTLAILKKYQQVLTRNNRQNIANMPAEYLTDCLLFNDITGASKYLEYGFPVQWKRDQERYRLLVNFEEDKPVDKSLFTLPEDYRRYKPFDVSN